MLKPSGFVKYHRFDPTLTEQGYKFGHMYQTVTDDQGVQWVLGVVAPDMPLTTKDGGFTDWSDHFSTVKVETILPRGIS